MRHTIPMETIRLVIERDEQTCQHCGKKGDYVIRFGKPAVVENPERVEIAPGLPNNDRRLIKFELHHRIPVFLGGDNSPDNLELYCRACNRSLSWVAQAAEFIKKSR